MPFPPKKKKADLALLMEAPGLDEEKPGDALDDMEPDEDLDDLGGDDMGAEMGSDPLEEEMAPEIDPEQAALAETLGFTEPDQQQALIDLIKLVTAPDMGGTDSGSDLPPLPESTY